MKIIVGFFLGIILSGLILFGVQAALPTRAESENTSLTSDNFSLVELLPDIERIYREALLLPLHEAKKEIYDEDVAAFYDRLLEKTSLDVPEEN